MDLVGTARVVQVDIPTFFLSAGDPNGGSEAFAPAGTVYVETAISGGLVGLKDGSGGGFLALPDWRAPVRVAPSLATGWVVGLVFLCTFVVIALGLMWMRRKKEQTRASYINRFRLTERDVS